MTISGALNIRDERSHELIELVRNAYKQSPDVVGARAILLHQKLDDNESDFVMIMLGAVHARTKMHFITRDVVSALLTNAINVVMFLVSVVLLIATLVIVF